MIFPWLCTVPEPPATVTSGIREPTPGTVNRHPGGLNMISWEFLWVSTRNIPKLYIYIYIEWISEFEPIWIKRSRLMKFNISPCILFVRNLPQKKRSKKVDPSWPVFQSAAGAELGIATGLFVDLAADLASEFSIRSVSDFRTAWCKTLMFWFCFFRPQ